MHLGLAADAELDVFIEASRDDSLLRDVSQELYTKPAQQELDGCDGERTTTRA